MLVFTGKHDIQQKPGITSPTIRRSGTFPRMVSGRSSSCVRKFRLVLRRRYAHVLIVDRDAAKHGIPFVSGDGIEHASRSRGYRGTWYGSFPPNLTSKSESSVGEKKQDKSKGPRGYANRRLPPLKSIAQQSLLADVAFLMCRQ